ncbi:MAG TPA: DUF465 domain-containing protein [Candidatus Methylomirabilis sp.]|nr:DUF465 domain-containing protein [Candidatus Methylomirabilis sp.]
MDETDAQLYARLVETDAEFRRLAEKHRALDAKVAELDRIYYLTSEQERKRKDLQKQKLALKDRLAVLMQEARRTG